MCPGTPLEIPFDILKLDEKYSDPAVEPDAEHRLIALLISEGAISEIVTTNWDPLIERAYSSLGRLPLLRSIACSQDIDGAPGRTIFKVHGCAEMSRLNPSRYKSHLIATDNHILNWTSKPEFLPIRERLSVLLRERPSLFVGISGQDFNLQVNFVQANLGQFDFPPARVTFAEEGLGNSQSQLLRAVHGEDAYWAHKVAIDEKATLRLFTKPLFGGLYVSLVLSKINKILEAGDATFMSEDNRNHARLMTDRLLAVIREKYDRLPRKRSNTLRVFWFRKPPMVMDLLSSVDSPVVRTSFWSMACG